MKDVESRFITINNNIEDRYIITRSFDSITREVYYKLYCTNYNELLIETSSSKEFLEFLFDKTRQAAFEDFLGFILE